jgi:hypothetical protein
VDKLSSKSPLAEYRHGRDRKLAVLLASIWLGIVPTAWSDEQGGSWAFMPARDSFDPTALLDLRRLNEKAAGEHGFIGLSRDRNSFVRGDGVPIRFWGGTSNVQEIARDKKDQRSLIYHANFLAKRGVNIVRVFAAIQPKKEGSKVTDVDAAELNQIHRAVAAMKGAGIYTTISLYWGSKAHLQRSWRVADPGVDNCAGLLFFDPVLQRGYKAWLKRVYANINPYTGIPLAQDPAVAMIHIQNEDSLLFWTVQSIKGQAMEHLRKLYGDWVMKKYGSIEKVRAAWQGCAHPDDNLAAGKPGIFIVWELTQAARNQKGDKGGRAVHLADQAEFTGRLMFDFNREIARYLREELGCQQLINAGNWRTADQVILDDVERWSYTADDVIAKNHYFGGLHDGVNSGWEIRSGQVFTSKSFTTAPQSSPLNVRQVVGHPFVITEGLWMPPSRYQSEGPIIVAAQSCLTGLDGFLWNATGVEDWETRGFKWIFATPTSLGQFPAAALIFRKACLQEGPVVVHEERGLQDLWQRKLPLIVEQGAWDPNRDKGQMPLGTPFKVGIDPLAYLVGRVEVKYGGDPSQSTCIDLTPYIDTAKKQVRSVTGEIECDLARGIYRINAPKAQGVVGMLERAGVQQLADVRIASSNEYASVTVVSLDDKPIATSGRLLVQIGTTSWLTGWREKPAQISTKEGPVEGSRILNAGGPPWQIEKMHGALGVRNGSLVKATALDPNGMATSNIPIWKGNGEIRIKLPSNALYVCLESATR